MRGWRFLISASASIAFFWVTVAGQNPPVDAHQLCEDLKDRMTVDVDCRFPFVTNRSRMAISNEYEVVTLSGGDNPGEFGIFIVNRKDGTHRLTIDILSDFYGDSVVLIDAGEDEVRCTVYANSDYGLIDRKVKYFFDLSKKTVQPGIDFHDQAVRQIATGYDQLLFLGDRIWVLLDPQNGIETAKVIDGENEEWWSQIPGFSDYAAAAKMVLAIGLPEEGLAGWTLLSRPADSRIAVRIGNETVELGPTEPSPGRERVGFQIRDQYYPVPMPSYETFQRLRPKQASSIRGGLPIFAIVIGPRELIGRQILFGIDFYDGEGFSGVGGYGVFDLGTREYEMHYLPEAVDWSCSALLVDGDEIWMGLRDRPEGADYSGGLLRHNRVTEESTHYDIPEIVHAIARWEDQIYLGTSNGIGVIKDGKLSRATFDVDREGKYYLRLER